MPFLPLIFGNLKLIAIGIAALAFAGLWLRADYLSNKLEARERTIALREAEIVSVADDANRNAAAATRIRADWERADAIVAQRDKDLADARKRLKIARNAANAVPASVCGPSQRLLAYVGGLRGDATSAVNGPPSAGGARNAPIPVAKPSVLR